MHGAFPGPMAMTRVDAATMLVWRLGSQTMIYSALNTGQLKSVLCWKTHVAGTPSGHFNVLL